MKTRNVIANENFLTFKFVLNIVKFLLTNKQNQNYKPLFFTWVHPASISGTLSWKTREYGRFNL